MEMEVEDRGPLTKRWGKEISWVRRWKMMTPDKKLQRKKGPPDVDLDEFPCQGGGKEK
jgi:hypothetical protein